MRKAREKIRASWMKANAGLPSGAILILVPLQPSTSGTKSALSGETRAMTRAVTRDMVIGVMKREIILSIEARNTFWREGGGSKEGEWEVEVEWWGWGARSGGGLRWEDWGWFGSVVWREGDLEGLEGGKEELFLREGEEEEGRG
jgi:hypothetical protein